MGVPYGLELGVRVRLGIRVSIKVKMRSSATTQSQVFGAQHLHILEFSSVLYQASRNHIYFYFSPIQVL